MNRFFFALLVASTLVIQDKPADVSQVPEDAKRNVLMLQQRMVGLSEAQAVLQREIDASTAELTRLVQRLQAAAPAGYELGPQLTYVKKEVKK